MRFPDTDTESTFNVIVDGMCHVEAGKRYVIRIPESAIHVFDRETGAALHNREIEDETELLASRV